MMRPVVALAMLAAAVPAGAAMLRVSSANVAQPGDVAQVCVALESAGVEVAGVQNDLEWDGACATLASADHCRIDEASGKQLFGALAPWGDYTYRVLVLSLADVDPIPDGRLYCCDFRVEAQPHSCCAVHLTQAAASDPNGNALGVGVGLPAQLCIGPFDGTPLPTSTPSFTPTPRLTPADWGGWPDDESGGGPDRVLTPALVPNGDSAAAVSGDGDGCQLASGAHAAAYPSVLIAAAIVLLRRRAR